MKKDDLPVVLMIKGIRVTVYPKRHPTTHPSGKRRKISENSIRWKERNLSKEEKRQARQQRRQERKQKKIEKAQGDGFYLSREWRELRYKILRKYGFRCMACGVGRQNAILHVDHIKPRVKYPELELDPDNLQVLCADCNIGKSHFFEDDLRPGRG